MSDSTTPRAPRLYDPRRCVPKDLLDQLSDLPQEFAVRLARRIVLGWDGYFAFAVATREEHYEETWDRETWSWQRVQTKMAQSHLFDVRRGTALRFLKQARRRSQTILLSDMF